MVFEQAKAFYDHGLEVAGRNGDDRRHERRLAVVGLAHRGNGGGALVAAQRDVRREPDR